MSDDADPATATLAGFLSGMFSKHVFDLLSKLIAELANKMTPEAQRSRTGAG